MEGQFCLDRLSDPDLIWYCDLKYNIFTAAAIIGSPRGSRSTWDEIEKQPYFLPTTTLVTVQEGGHAFFICKVENLYNQTVSTFFPYSTYQSVSKQD